MPRISNRTKPSHVARAFARAAKGTDVLAERERMKSIYLRRFGESGFERLQREAYLRLGDYLELSQSLRTYYAAGLP